MSTNSSHSLLARTSRSRSAKSASNDARPLPPQLDQRHQLDQTLVHLLPLRKLDRPKHPDPVEQFPSLLLAIPPLALVLRPRHRITKRSLLKRSRNSNPTNARRSRLSTLNVSLVVPRRRSRRYCRSDSRGSKRIWRRREDRQRVLEVSSEGKVVRKRGRERRRSESLLNRRVRSRRRSSTRPFFP